MCIEQSRVTSNAAVQQQRTQKAWETLVWDNVTFGYYQTDDKVWRGTILAASQIHILLRALYDSLCKAFALVYSCLCFMFVLYVH